MPERTPLDWENLERELHAAGVSPKVIEAGARQMLARTRGHQLAETAGSCAGARSRSEHGSAVLESVLGATPRGFESRILHLVVDLRGCLIVRGVGRTDCAHPG